MRGVVLFGAGSPVVVDVEESCARRGWPILAALRNVAVPDRTSGDVPVRPLAPDEVIADPVLLPLFTPDNRRLAWTQAMAHGAREFPTLIDPTAILPRRLSIGEGGYVNAGCTIGAAARFGRFVFVNRGAVLGHHLELGDFVSIGPGVVIAGEVVVEEGARIGAGAVILPGIRIGAGASIAAGAVIRRDVTPGAEEAAR